MRLGRRSLGGADPEYQAFGEQLDARRFAPCTPVQELSPTA